MAHWALLLVTYTVANQVNPVGSTSVLTFALAGVSHSIRKHFRIGTRRINCLYPHLKAAFLRVV